MNFYYDYFTTVLPRGSSRGEQLELYGFFVYAELISSVWFTLAAECTFENFLGSSSGLCGWTQDTTDDFNWRRQSGSTSSYRTGPSFDHTYGTNKGRYTGLP